MGFFPVGGGGGSGNATSIQGIAVDTDAQTPASGDMLVYDGTDYKSTSKTSSAGLQTTYNFGTFFLPGTSSKSLVLSPNEIVLTNAANTNGFGVDSDGSSNIEAFILSTHRAGMHIALGDAYHYNNQFTGGIAGWDGSGNLISSQSSAINGLISQIWQSNIPFILCSSGTMGNNGALSGITALDEIYSSGAYISLPAGAISSGSVAGWYYFVASSTSAGQVFNNVYSTGIPSIPATPVAFSTTGPGAFTQVLTEILGPNFTMPANTMGAPNDGLQFAFRTSYNNSAGTKTIRFRIGGSGITGTSIWANPQTTTAGGGGVFEMQNSGIITSQSMTPSGQSFTTLSGASASSHFSFNFGTALLVASTMLLTNASDFLVINMVRTQLAKGA